MTAPTHPASAAAPLAPDERVVLLDVVRGFALWGVCLANLVPWFSGYQTLSEKARAALPTWPADRMTEALLAAFVHSRFFTIFSFLFGLGFAVQYLRAEARGVNATRLLARRLVAMLALGLAHLFLLWYGDILATYATAGVMLLVARRWPARRLLAVGVALAVGVPIATTLLVKLLPVITHGAVNPAAGQAAAQALFTGRLPVLVATPSYAALLEANRVMAAEFYTSPYFPTLLAELAGLFLLGLCVGRAGLLRTLDGRRGVWRLALGWAAAVAFVGYGPRLALHLADVKAAALPQDVLGMLRVLRHVGQPAMSLAYVCALVLLFQRPGWRRRLLVLAPVGQMALTNYLTQSVVGVTLFYGIGLGLYGRVGPTLLVALSVAIIAAQAVASRWWLARFRFGPAEWLWRSLTYGRAQPMRIRAAGDPAPRAAAPA